MKSLQRHREVLLSMLQLTSLLRLDKLGMRTTSHEARLHQLSWLLLTSRLYCLNKNSKWSSHNLSHSSLSQSSLVPGIRQTSRLSTVGRAVLEQTTRMTLLPTGTVPRTTILRISLTRRTSTLRRLVGKSPASRTRLTAIPPIKYTTRAETDMQFQ